MANTKSAKKSTLQNEVRRRRNLARRTAIKTAIKKVHVSLAQSAEPDVLRQLLGIAAAQLARAQSKRVIHHNTASRKLSRLALKVAQATRATV
jgi:small subunit ribosomal protein S20